MVIVSATTPVSGTEFHMNYGMNNTILFVSSVKTLKISRIGVMNTNENGK